MKYTSIKSADIFEADQYFNNCHASSIVSLPGERLAASWFAGTKEGADDVAIWIAIREDGNWGTPIKIADEENLPHWNPVLYYTVSGQLQLYYKVGKKVKNWWTRFICSEDHGRTWSSPIDLVPGDIGGRGPVRCKPILLADETLISPASIETNDSWDAFVDISHDEGKTWTQSAYVPFDRNRFYGVGMIQPTVWETAKGVHMLVRTSTAEIYRSDSTDGGRSWCEAYPIGLPNNNSGIDLVQLDNGNLVLIFNPVGLNWGPRTPLILRSSSDNGKTWGEPFVLEKEPGEYSYPAIIANGNHLYMTYTWKRKTIKFCEVLVE